MARARVFFLMILLAFLGCKNSKELETSKQNDHSIQEALKPSKNTALDFKQRLKWIDSAHASQQKKPIDKLTLAILYDKSALHYKLKQSDSASFYDDLLLRKSSLLGDDYYMGRASHRLAYDFKSHGVYDSAYFYYNISKNAFQNLGDSSQVGRRLMSMGLIQKDQNDFFGSKETLTEALQFLKSPKDDKYIASCFNALATNHRKLLNYKDAVVYYLKAIEFSDLEMDKLIYTNNLSATYIDHGAYAKAIGLLQEALKNSSLQKRQREYARVVDNLAYALWLAGENATPENLIKALDIRISDGDKRGQIASYTHLGEYYTANDFRKAHVYFDSAMRLSKSLKIPRAEQDVLRFLIDLNPKNIALRDRYTFLQDSMYSQELKVKTQFAKYKYDDRLKQESILNLQTEKAVQELEVAKERNYKVTFVFAFFMACLGSGFIYYFFKQRNKNLKKKATFLKQRNKIEKLEAVYETEAQLSRRLHDDFGAQLNHTMLLIQNNAEKSILLDKIDGLYQQSRDFSREINDVDTGASYKDELFEMLRVQTPPSTKLYTTGSKEIEWSKISGLNKTVLYKVLREIMMNMATYSEASLVTITFLKVENFLRIKYFDDGVGASVEALNSKNGLRNTEKRIQAIDGTIIFESEKGKGFKVEINIPN
ncbi:hypothetical protein [uncultured Kriegella sp.]|uniref:tetratricopeptide repeat-containing sensor histidine kinase n=1 Tax=uncultured Kriegella sp. TaxID=1798910 RepID=UPI0030D8693A